MSELYITRKDLLELAEVAKQFDVDMVRVRQDSSSGIGYCLYLTVPVTVSGITGEFTITTADERNW